MDFRGLVKRTRSYRRFKEDEPLDPRVLKGLVELVRYCPSVANLQPLRFLLVTDSGERDQLFPLLRWAAYLSHWPGPAPGQWPAAYIVVCSDRALSSNCSVDVGIASQVIRMGAMDEGIGSCLIGSFDRKEVKSLLGIGPGLGIELVIALGRPGETVVTEELGGSTRYYRDAKGVHHVPKPGLKQLLVNRRD